MTGKAGRMATIPAQVPGTWASVVVPQHTYLSAFWQIMPRIFCNKLLYPALPLAVLLHCSLRSRNLGHFSRLIQVSPDLQRLFAVVVVVEVVEVVVVVVVAGTAQHTYLVVF